ncbi:MAG: hypothetical protein CM1200mP38_5040 [Dehalococcoidia bacterium]|nr:MAG: hypothetical protein CM1200mP38_5040 [Dehalococcoidia bacterium]
MSLNGFPDGPPVKTTFPLIDRITPLHATMGFSCSTRKRIFRRGQSIDVSLADTGFTKNEIPISAFLEMELKHPKRVTEKVLQERIKLLMVG